MELANYIIAIILLILSILNYYFHFYRTKLVSDFLIDLNRRVGKHNRNLILNGSFNDLIEINSTHFNYNKLIYSFKRIKPEKLLDEEIYKKLYQDEE